VAFAFSFSYLLHDDLCPPLPLLLLLSHVVTCIPVLTYAVASNSRTAPLLPALFFTCAEPHPAPPTSSSSAEAPLLAPSPPPPVTPVTASHSCAVEGVFGYDPRFCMESAVQYCLAVNGCVYRVAFCGNFRSLASVVALRSLSSSAAAVAALPLLRFAELLHRDGDRDVARLLFACALAAAAWVCSALASAHAAFQLQVLQQRISSVMRAAAARKLLSSCARARAASCAAG
jgi:hypothetical protein